MKRIPTLVMTLLGAAVALAAALAYWPSSPFASVSGMVVADVVVVALAIVAAVVAARSGQWQAPSWTLWIACGALLGAAAAGPVKLALWLVPASLAIGAAGVFARLHGLGGALRRLGLAFGALIVNFAFLWSATTGGGSRLAPEEFQAADFRVNSFLADVPLHDVWVFHLQGGEEGLTLPDAQEVLAVLSPFEANTAVAVLAGSRMLLGGLLGLDHEKYFDQSSSYANRLTEEDRARNLEQPGTASELFRTVYAFENEELAEMMNRTAHAFFCMAIEPADDGYTMYWAIYVRETSGLTPIYMSLIDPFRRYIVYPGIVRSVERTWAARWNE
ncbi:MAG: DUF2867 domain-containing protein [Gemmatimonadota bacterium]|nr:MAG: DUF2867 domain-containing protein [Gemmatimonadota bacterium]